MVAPLLCENDARAMVRLVAEVAALNTDHTTAKRHLMNGLAEMIGADCWVWMLGYLNPEKPPVYVSIQHAGFDEERFARYLQAIEHPDMKELTAPFSAEVMTRKQHVTRLRQQVDPAGKFLKSDVYPLWLTADLAPLILSAEPLDGDCVSLIGLYRRADAPLFDERENRIAHILLTEVSWLHAAGWPDDFAVDVPKLSRSRRLVLNLLLEGLSRKVIANRLNLSIHTVGDYVKDIYRTFGVRSHAELLRRFTRGDNNDRQGEPKGAAEGGSADADKFVA